jgi:hypothetical protein
MTEEISSDHVIDTIAAIRLQRQEIAKQPDAEAWRSGALAKLQEILDQVQEAVRLHVPSAERLADAEALKAEMNMIRARRDAQRRPDASRKRPGRTRAPGSLRTSFSRRGRRPASASSLPAAKRS